MGFIDKLFWAWFVLSAFAVVFVILKVESIDLITRMAIGLVVILIGIAKLAQETSAKRIRDVSSTLTGTVRWIEQGLEKLNESEKDENEKCDVLAKKVAQLENRTNDTSTTLTPEMLDLKSKEVEIVNTDKVDIVDIDKKTN